METCNSIDLCIIVIFLTVCIEKYSVAKRTFAVIVCVLVFGSKLRFTVVDCDPSQR